MFTLFAMNGSGSAAVEALVAELGLPLRLELVERGEDNQFPASFKAISPLAQVPVLKLPDGSIMTESAAMMVYLADLVPQAGLAPSPSDPERAHYLRVLLFLAASTYPVNLRYFYPERYTTDPQGAAGVKAAGDRDTWRDFSILASLLGEREWFTGKFGAADIYAATLVSWCEDVVTLTQREPRLAAHLNRVKSRPKTGSVFSRNGL